MVTTILMVVLVEVVDPMAAAGAAAAVAVIQAAPVLLTTIRVVVVVVPTTHPVRMRPAKQAHVRAMVKWSLPIALVSALNLRLWWPITIMLMLPLLQEPIIPMAAAAPWKLLIFH